MKVRSHSVDDREPGQVRKEAALSGPVYAQWGNLTGVDDPGTASRLFLDGGCTVTLRAVIKRREAVVRPRKPSSAVPANFAAIGDNGDFAGAAGRRFAASRRPCLF
jgi:hypothetical protein